METVSVHKTTIDDLFMLVLVLKRHFAVSKMPVTNIILVVNTATAFSVPGISYPGFLIYRVE